MIKAESADEELRALLKDLVEGQFLDLSMVRKLSTILPGEHDSVRLGRGQEFYDVHPYQPLEDPISAVDIALSRHLGKLMSRIFFEEKELHVFFLFDTSKQMLWGGKKAGKLPLMLKSAALIGFAVLQKMNALGGACPGLNQSFYEPQHRRGELINLLKTVLKNTGIFSTEEIWGRMPGIVRMIKQPSLLVIFSDFFVEESLLKSVLRNSCAHEIIPVITHSHYEHALPLFNDGSFTDFSGDVKHQIEANSPLVRRLFEKKIRDYENKLRAVFMKFGIANFIHVSNPETLFDDIFFKKNIIS